MTALDDLDEWRVSNGRDPYAPAAAEEVDVAEVKVEPVKNNATPLEFPFAQLGGNGQGDEGHKLGEQAPAWSPVKQEPNDAEDQVMVATPSKRRCGDRASLAGGSVVGDEDAFNVTDMDAKQIRQKLLIKTPRSRP
jgi:hypothetical protein